MSSCEWHDPATWRAKADPLLHLDIYLKSLDLSDLYGFTIHLPFLKDPSSKVDW